ncbi:GNAT family N-acetyltransferase [Erythrobacter sp. EC-HK427]|uniref:GNAT family N-acetyltransferase n=1 Tax=Erythrobacter sp. EC-HK427 TaxID=2038396 RepID=UPI001255329F|nr:GNAT family N-acetyltransferase [Erythrobacter sp. EC-HK427]VVT17793.1 conserved hypothetical protein [Erythrobacter sp. EC-HK427]
MTGSPAVRWNAPEDIPDAAAFAARVIGAQASYISHGEIQTGLSDDGVSWIPDLEERYAADFADPGDRDMLVARGVGGAVCGMLIVAFEHGEHRSFAVIEDMAVDPQARSGGIGRQLLERAMERIAARGIDWVFLESGLHNEDAHRFFEKNGFAKLSSVFGRRLTT